MPPSGNTSEAAQAYYQYLYQHRLEAVVAPRVDILWQGPFWIAVFGITLIGFFALYAFSLQQVHRKHGEIYGVVSFAGSLLERIGSVSTFDWFVWTATILWAAYFVVTHIVRGQFY
jgi:hypothetical protein